MLTKKQIDVKYDYRVESGSVYLYSKSAKAYVFHGKLNGKSVKQYFNELERMG